MATRNGRVRGTSPELIAAARDLRVQQTVAEQIVWEVLRGRRLDGFKFRRQYPVGTHILDFVCIDNRLVVELDGAYHAREEQRRFDQERTEHLEQYGYRVIRFTNEAVFSDLDRVVDAIRFYLSISGPISKCPRKPPSLSQDWEREGGLGEE